MTDRPQTPLLDQIASPADLKRLSDAQLEQLAHELRQETISAVSVTGGHLGAGLGVVEEQQRRLRFNMAQVTIVGLGLTILGLG